MTPFERLESKVAAHESRLAALEAVLCGPARDRDIAKALGRSKRTVRRLRSEEKLPKSGSLWSEVFAAMSSNGRALEEKNGQE